MRAPGDGFQLLIAGHHFAILDFQARNVRRQFELLPIFRRVHHLLHRRLQRRLRNRQRTDLAAYRLEMQITIRRREPPLELQGHIFAVEIEDHVRADAIVDQFYLHVTHRRAHLLQLLGISSGRRRKIGGSVVPRRTGRLSLGWSTGSNVEMRREIRVQLRLIEPKRRGLAAGHRLLDSFKLLLDLRRRLRAGDNNGSRHGVKSHQQGDNCSEVRRPAYDAESKTQGTQLAWRHLFGDSTVAWAAGGIHDAASSSKLDMACTDPKAAKRLQQENARTGATKWAPAETEVGLRRLSYGVPRHSWMIEERT